MFDYKMALAAKYMGCDKWQHVLVGVHLSQSAYLAVCKAV
jgi:hypothetical protein